MRQYLDLLRLIRTAGTRKSDRTGTGTLSVFAQQLRFDLAQGFPLVTTKNVHLRSVVYELLWFLRGETNIAWLHEHERQHLGRMGGCARRARTGVRQAVARLAQRRR